MLIRYGLIAECVRRVPENIAVSEILQLRNSSLNNKQHLLQPSVFQFNCFDLRNREETGCYEVKRISQNEERMFTRGLSSTRGRGSKRTEVL